jgi:hypothetical protein
MCKTQRRSKKCGKQTRFWALSPSSSDYVTASWVMKLYTAEMLQEKSHGIHGETVN